MGIRKVERAIVAVMAITFLSCTFAAGTARGADPTAARQEAKRLRDQAAQAIERGEFAAALEDFRRAYALFPSPNLHFNIGFALYQLGAHADAVDAFENFLAAAPSAPREAREFAIARLAELHSQLARLELIVTPPDARVTLDGRPIELPRARALPVIPGERTLAAAKAGHTAIDMRLTLLPGEVRRVELNLPRESPSPSEAPPRLSTPRFDAQPSTTRTRASKHYRAIGLSVGATGVGLIGAGIAFGVLAQHAADDITRLAQMRLPFDSSKYSAGTAYQVLEGVCFGVGAAAAATGTILYVLGRKAEKKSQLATVTAAVSQHAIGVALEGRF